ncbi:uncharacterized protein LOC144124478 isoform X3 [Amblyomma americanum]
MPPPPQAALILLRLHRNAATTAGSSPGHRFSNEGVIGIATLQMILYLLVLRATATAEESANSILHRQQDDHGNYEFGFNIDGLSWDQFQRESGDALGRKTGAYGFRDADGRLRLVEYVADELGFRVKVQTNEPGTRGSTMPSAVVDASPDASAQSESAAIVSPPPARLLRRLSPAPPIVPRTLAAKAPGDPNGEVAAAHKDQERVTSSLRLAPSKSLAEKFDAPLVPTGAVKMEAYTALRQYRPNIYQLGRPVYLGNAAPYYRPPYSMNPSAYTSPYASQPRDNGVRGAALVPKEVNGRVVAQVALIRADGTLSTDDPHRGSTGYPPQILNHRAPLPGSRLFSEQQNAPNIGNIFPINTVHPASLGFPAEPSLLYGLSYNPDGRQSLPPPVPQRLPAGLTVNYFLANSLPLTGRPEPVTAPLQQTLPPPPPPRAVHDTSQRADPEQFVPQQPPLLPSPPPGYYGRRLYPQAQPRQSAGSHDLHRDLQVDPHLLRQYAYAGQEGYARRLPQAYTPQQVPAA